MPASSGRNILGISCHYHDAAACLLQDGEIAAAAQEERFSRIKNDPAFPIRAINYCLQARGLSTLDIDHIVFYEKPYLKFSRVILSHMRAYPASLASFLEAMPAWLDERLALPLKFKEELSFEGTPFFIKHHLSHAASAFLVSPFEEAAILTADGVGEWATTACGMGKGRGIRMLKELRFPDSLGLLYTAVTTYLGFEALRGEGKVMGLASYGKPAYLDKFRRLAAVKPDGSFRMDPAYFAFHKDSRMYSRRFVEEFGPERAPGTELTERHHDIAASLQAFTEEVLVAMARRLHEETRADNLCLAGGVFLNCVANSAVFEKTPFREVFIQPCAGDGGGALGAAAYVWHSVLGKQRTRSLEHAYLGPAYSSKEAERAVLASGLSFKRLSAPELARQVAGRLSQGEIVGWFQGRMEFGPRALGGRSILADPRKPDMKDLLNAKVKKRESFRPYAPAVLEERAADYFEAKGFSPFMLLAARVRAEKRAVIPAVTHVDGTARVQTVSAKANPAFRRLIEEFDKLTGVPMLLNTSFNLSDEPIVCSPRDALDSFQRSRMDCLVLEDLVVDRPV
ncbi:MAG: carbamoyltransferase [Elusimicrobiota bacterium]